MMRTSLSSSVSFARLRCVRVSMYSFLVFWMKVSAVWSIRLSECGGGVVHQAECVWGGRGVH